MTITENDILDTIYSNQNIQDWNVDTATKTVTKQMSSNMQKKVEINKLMKRVRRISKRLFHKERIPTIHGSPMNKTLYKTFLRLNDRKKTQWAEDFRKAKYHEAVPNDRTVAGDWNAIHIWCEEKFGLHGYTWTGHIFWFENERDKLMFLLRWG